MLNHVQLCDPRVHRLLCPWDSPGKNTGVGCHWLLFLSQGPNPGPPALQADSLLSEPPGKPQVSTGG